MAGTFFFSKFLDKIFGSLWGRLFIVVTQTVLSSLVLLFIFTLRQSGDINLLKYSIVFGIGFIAGFSARSFLSKETRFLKILAALSSSALSLAIIFPLSGGFLGLNLFSPLNKTPDWEGLIQFALAALGATLVVLAFRSASSAPWIKDPPAPASRHRVSSQQSSPVINRWLPKLSFPSGKKKIQKSSRVRSANKAPLSITKSKSRKSPVPLAIAKAKAKSPAKKPAKISKPKKLAVASSKSKTKKQTRPKTKRLKKKDIKFTGVEEHSCPYCLDPVEAHDARGVKICKVCKTHHHADCWGITGACQIPHSYSK